MTTESLSQPQSSTKPPVQQFGHWRLRLKTASHPHTWCTVGAFPSPRPALTFANDLVNLADGLVVAVRIERRTRRGWAPAWWA